MNELMIFYFRTCIKTKKEYVIVDTKEKKKIKIKPKHEKHHTLLEIGVERSKKLF